MSSPRSEPYLGMVPRALVEQRIEYLEKGNELLHYERLEGAIDALKWVIGEFIPIEDEMNMLGLPPDVGPTDEPDH